MNNIRGNLLIGILLGIIGGYFGYLISIGLGRSSLELFLGLFVAFLMSFFVYYYFGIKIDRWFVNILAALCSGLIIGFSNGSIPLAMILGITASLFIYPIIQNIHAQITTYTAEHPRIALMGFLIILMSLAAPILVWGYSRNIHKEIAIVLLFLVIPILVVIVPRIARML